MALRRIYVLFFIELESRRLHLAGLTSDPHGDWIVQQARNLTIDLGERERSVRVLLHDRDAKFSAAFDEVFRSEGVRIIRTPIRAPNANAFAERWVRTLRSECLDWLLIFSRRQLERVLRTYVDHYNRQRPHRALDLDVPVPAGQPVRLARSTHGTVRRRDRLGGLVHEYEHAAWRPGFMRPTGPVQSALPWFASPNDGICATRGGSAPIPSKSCQDGPDDDAAMRLGIVGRCRGLH